jgi:transcriptional regulator with XRE-family HTH domain
MVNELQSSSVRVARPDTVLVKPQFTKRQVDSRKKPFDGFSDADIKTTKNVQKYYSEIFSSKRLRQDAVASTVGWSQSTLNLYINGKQKIGDKALRKFCLLFKVTPDKLSPEYDASNFVPPETSAQSDEMVQMKNILVDLLDAIDSKKDLGAILLRAKKHIINE